MILFCFIYDNLFWNICASSVSDSQVIAGMHRANLLYWTWRYSNVTTIASWALFRWTLFQFPVEVPWIFISCDIFNLFYYIFINFNKFYSVLGYFICITKELFSFYEFRATQMNFIHFWWIFTISTPFFSISWRFSIQYFCHDMIYPFEKASVYFKLHSAC